MQNTRERDVNLEGAIDYFTFTPFRQNTNIHGIFLFVPGRGRSMPDGVDWNATLEKSCSRVSRTLYIKEKKNIPFTFPRDKCCCVRSNQNKLRLVQRIEFERERISGEGKKSKYRLDIDIGLLRSIRNARRNPDGKVEASNRRVLSTAKSIRIYSFTLQYSTFQSRWNEDRGFLCSAISDLDSSDSNYD